MKRISLFFVCVSLAATAHATVFDSVSGQCQVTTVTPTSPTSVPLTLGWSGVTGSTGTTFFSSTFDTSALPRKVVMTGDVFHSLEDVILMMTDGQDGEMSMSVDGLACAPVSESALFTGMANDLQGSAVTRVSLEVTAIGIVGQETTVDYTLRFTDNEILTRETAVAPGTLCPNGGRKLESGSDDIVVNGTLDDSEVSATAYVCDPLDAFDARVVVTAVAPDPLQCANGGFKIESGLDDDRNGTLDPAEIDTTEYACNGATGPAGSNGTNGENGANGSNGQNGENGVGATGPQGPPGANGVDGLSPSCTVKRQDASTIIVTCEDGVTALSTTKGGCRSSGASLLAAMLSFGVLICRRALRRRSSAT